MHTYVLHEHDTNHVKITALFDFQRAVSEDQPLVYVLYFSFSK